MCQLPGHRLPRLTTRPTTHVRERKSVSLAETRYYPFLRRGLTAHTTTTLDRRIGLSFSADQWRFHGSDLEHAGEDRALISVLYHIRHCHSVQNSLPIGQAYTLRNNAEPTSASRWFRCCRDNTLVPFGIVVAGAVSGAWGLWWGGSLGFCQSETLFSFAVQDFSP